MSLGTVLRGSLCGMLITVVVGLGPMSTVRAEMISTDAALTSVSTDRARAELAALLAREDVQAELAALGVDPAEAQGRMATLSDAEVLEVHGRLQELPAGASFAGAVAGVLLVTVTVLVITDLLGVTDVFSFIRPLPGPRTNLN